ncbi:MAG: sugar ABC transporter permease [Propionibacteriaceae bacterium]|jgi:ABC-type sugar transport system permease subunit|nr:sugar ABC transporter permease [Propionibacteriaceae bacterium]
MTALSGALPKRKRIRYARTTGREKIEIAALAGPAVLIFVSFVIFPVVMALRYGLYKWKGFGEPTDFVGLQNYVIILQDPLFHQALLHNGMIVVLSLLMQGPIALLLALLINRKLRFRSVIRVLLFVPYVISEVISGTGWGLMLQTNGAVDELMRSIGLGWAVQEWLSDPKIAIWSLMVILTWKFVGFSVILFLAGMQGIPDELSEAARVDGASFWQIQRRIILPLLGPTIRIWGFLTIIGCLQVFDLVYIIWGQYISATAGTSTMATYMAQNGRLSGNFGYGNAVAVVIFLISMTVALLYQRFILNRDTEGAITEGGK